MTSRTIASSAGKLLTEPDGGLLSGTLRFVLESNTLNSPAQTYGDITVTDGAYSGAIDVGVYTVNFVVASGTAIAAVNRRMDITSSSSMLIQQVATITTTGDLVVPSANLAAPTVGGNTIPSEAAGLFDGFVLVDSETYLIGLRNTSVDTATVWANFAFFEPIHL